MYGGARWLAAAAVLACTACLGNQGKLEIRSVDRGIAPGEQPVPFRVAEARAHLALGNVALALEGFRKAAREEPASIEALAGIADCYDRLGRFDLSQRFYEKALAVAPHNEGVLAAFAGSLLTQGRTAEADAVRRELAALMAARAQPAAADETSAAPLKVADAPSTPIPPEHASPVGQSVTIVLPPVRPIETSETPKSNVQSTRVVPVGPSVTIALPRPPAPPRAQSPKQASSERQPRLVRLSLSEVALVTGGGPRWKRPEPVRQAIRKPPLELGELRLLNAARVHRLAARTRSYLNGHGWPHIVVGDAAIVRSRSLILYPRGSQAAARQLADRLGFAAVPRDDVRQVTILLGRDAAVLPALRKG